MRRLCLNFSFLGLCLLNLSGPAALEPVREVFPENNSSLQVSDEKFEANSEPLIYGIAVVNKETTGESKSRKKRFLGPLANLITFHLFPVPVLPSNFIGLQLTVVAPPKPPGHNGTDLTKPPKEQQNGRPSPAQLGSPPPSLPGYQTSPRPGHVRRPPPPPAGGSTYLSPGKPSGVPVALPHPNAARYPPVYHQQNPQQQRPRHAQPVRTVRDRRQESQYDNPTASDNQWVPVVADANQLPILGLRSSPVSGGRIDEGDVDQPESSTAIVGSVGAVNGVYRAESQIYPVFTADNNRRPEGLNSGGSRHRNEYTASNGLQGTNYNTYYKGLNESYVAPGEVGTDANVDNVGVSSPGGDGDFGVGLDGGLKYNQRASGESETLKESTTNESAVKDQENEQAQPFSVFNNLKVNSSSFSDPNLTTSELDTSTSRPFYKLNPYEYPQDEGNKDINNVAVLNTNNTRAQDPHFAIRKHSLFARRPNITFGRRNPLGGRLNSSTDSQDVQSDLKSLSSLGKPSNTSVGRQEFANDTPVPLEDTDIAEDNTGHIKDEILSGEDETSVSNTTTPLASSRQTRPTQGYRRQPILYNRWRTSTSQPEAELTAGGQKEPEDSTGDLEVSDSTAGKEEESAVATGGQNEPAVAETTVVPSSERIASHRIRNYRARQNALANREVASPIETS